MLQLNVNVAGNLNLESVGWRIDEIANFENGERGHI